MTTYAHIENDTNGIVHEYEVPVTPGIDRSSTTCGKSIHPAWNATDQPITCKMCVNVIRAGWNYRQMHDLTALAEEITYEADSYNLPDRITEIIGQFANVLDRKKPKRY